MDAEDFLNLFLFLFFDDGIARYFTRFGGIFVVVVVDLWEAQPCLGDPE